MSDSRPILSGYIDAKEFFAVGFLPLFVAVQQAIVFFI